MEPKETLIYVIEDETDIARLISFNLSLIGYQVKTFANGEEGLSAVIQDQPNLLLLDIMLPGMSGLEICKKIRAVANFSQMPIIMVSAKGSELDIVQGLELGADDYITKPFSPMILSARVGAILRRIKQNTLVSAEGVLTLNNLVIHPGKHEVTSQGHKVDLTPSEFQILYFLAQKAGWVFTRSQIVDAIHGMHHAVTERTIDFQMVGIRKKLGPAGENIETVRGIGYRYKEA